MEWLVLFLAVAVVAGAVVWFAGRALRRRPERSEGDTADEPVEHAGPRHYDVAAGVDEGEGGDPSS